MFWKSAPREGGERCGASLISMMGAGLGLAAVISFVILSVLCLSENFLDEAYFARWYGKVEVAALKRNLVAHENGKLAVQQAPELAHYWGENSNAYSFRVWDKTGTIVASINHHEIERWSPIGPEGAARPDFWQSKSGPNWFEIVYGKRATVGKHDVWIEVGTRGDPDGRRYGALYADFVHDVVRPLVPTFSFAAALALATLFWALRPVTAAANAALDLRPCPEGKTTLRLPAERLPREVATLASAVNALLARTEELMQSQSDFIGRAAHQLQTPLATMLLEVNRMPAASARQLERDILKMSETVNRLLELARMQGLPPIDRGTLGLVALAEDVAMDLEALAAERGSSIVVTDRNCVDVLGDHCTLREALSNIVANAIVHHPGAARVEIICGPGPVLTVDDDGAGLAGVDQATLFEPFARGRTTASGAGLGLALVKRIVTLHHGAVEAGASPSGGARFVMRLSAAPSRSRAVDCGDVDCAELFEAGVACARTAQMT